MPTYFVDTRLPFGGRRAPGIFHRLSQSVRHIMLRQGFHSIVVYLDDFLIIGRTKEECQHAFDTLMQLLLDLGFQLAPARWSPQCQQLVFLGVQFDTINLELSLPQTKLEETREAVASFLTRNRATKRQLQRLAGKSNWACRVIYGGCTFLRHVIDCINALQSSSAKCKLTLDFSSRFILVAQLFACIQW